MTDRPGERENIRALDPQEIKKGLPVWVQLNKKVVRVAATIRDHAEDRSRFTVDLEIDDPTHPGQVIRQAYPKPVQVFQLTRREGPPTTEIAPEPERIPALKASLEPEATTSVPAIRAADLALDAASLTTYSRETLCFQGPHDQARRAWLRTFAQGRGYQAFWFTLHGSRSGYYQAGVPAGEEGWTHFLERAVQFDIYCAFIAAYAPGLLEQFLADAAARGEITLGMDTGLPWTPGNHPTPR